MYGTNPVIFSIERSVKFSVICENKGMSEFQMIIEISFGIRIRLFLLPFLYPDCKGVLMMKCIVVPV